jgi:hypothetical protein
VAATVVGLLALRAGEVSQLGAALFVAINHLPAGLAWLFDAFYGPDSVWLLIVVVVLAAGAKSATLARGSL